MNINVSVRNTWKSWGISRDLESDHREMKLHERQQCICRVADPAVEDCTEGDVILNV